MRLLQVKAVEKVFQIIAESFGPLEAEEVLLSHAGGRITAEIIVAPEDVPAFERSTVDGYAVSASETFGAQEGLPAMLELVGEVCMGESAPKIGTGECCYVPTGGMLPSGSDAVVMIEQTEVTGTLVHIYRQVAPGENRIQRGEDLQSGQVVLERGRRLRAPELGLLASLGITRFKVVRRPIIAILSSGDELVPVETQVLAPGQIRDSNSVALAYLAAQMGGEVLRGGILPDCYPDFYEGVSRMLKRADMVVLSGGSSVGNRDYTTQVLQELGEGGLLVEGMAIQPGKPTLLAKCQGKPVLGLPGHPVSALNIFTLVGGAIIRSMSGSGAEVWRPSVPAILARNIVSRPGVTELVRVSIKKTEKGTVATPIFGRSGLLRTLAEANGTIWVPAEAEGLAAGEKVAVFLWE